MSKYTCEFGNDVLFLYCLQKLSIKPLTADRQYIYVKCSSECSKQFEKFLFCYVNIYGDILAYILTHKYISSWKYLINLSVSINSKSALSTLSINLLKIAPLTISLLHCLSMEKGEILVASL